MLQGGIANGWMRELLGDDPEGRLMLGYALAQVEEVPPAEWAVQWNEDFVAPNASPYLQLLARIVTEERRGGSVVDSKGPSSRARRGSLEGFIPTP